MVKRSKRFIAALSILMLSGSFINSNILAKEQSLNEEVDIPYINPVIQKLNKIGEGFTITNTVNIIGENEADKEALDSFKKLLEENNISISENYDKNNTTIILGEHNDEVVKRTIDGLDLDLSKVLDKEEGYVLYSSNNNEGEESGIILLAGIDETGTYYGVSTLKKLLVNKTDVRIPEVIIEDFPDIQWRGIVEGFYGEPYSHENRKDLLKFSGEFKMNSYMYGPKDDEYHRSKWREPYPDKEAKKLSELAEIAKKNHVDFIWAIHPGLDIKFTEEDYNALLNKFELMYDLGVRSFAVFFDDISGAGTDGANQAEFLNRLNKDFIQVKHDVTPLIMCPTEYNKDWADKRPGTYLDILGENLDSNIEIMWTGDNVISDINHDNLQWVKNRIKRDPYVWWNYPVNGYGKDKLLLGEVYGIEKNVDNASGFVSNPMNEAQISKFALYSIANYTWNVDVYDYKQSWEKAILELVPEIEEDFKLFSVHNSHAGNKYPRKESEHLVPIMNEFKNKINNNEDLEKETERLLLEFKRINEAAINIKNNCNNKELIKELDNWLLSFEYLGIFGDNVISSLIALKENDYETWWSCYQKANNAKEEMDKIDKATIDWDNEKGTKVATKNIMPFLKEMMNKSERMYIEKIYENDNSVYSLNPFTNYKNGENIENMVDGDDSTYYYAKIKQQNGDYYGVDLGKVIPIESIRILQGRTDTDHDIFQRGILEYSVDGNIWTTIGEERSGFEIKETQLNLEARYIRYRLTHAGIPGGKPDLWTAVREFSVNGKENFKANTNALIYEGNVNNLIDGNFNTYLWTKEQKENDYYEIHLGKETPLHEVTIYSNKKDYLRSAVLEISNDNKNWTTIKNITEEDGIIEEDYHKFQIKLNGEKAKYIRVKITAPNKKWTKIHEIEINKNSDEQNNSLITGNPLGDFNKLIDKKVNTAYIANTKPIAGDELIYKLDDTKELKNIYILQDKKAISNATVKIKNSNNEWINIGILDKAFNHIDLENISNKNISEIKILWDKNSPLPIIYEINTLYNKNNLSTEKPNKPTNLLFEEVTSNSLSLNWNAPNNIEIREYIIYKDGIEIAKIDGKETSYKVENLSSNTLHGFKIVAKGINNKISRPISKNIRTLKIQV